MKNKIIFLIIALLAFFLRFWQLDKFPVSLNWDEVSHGYNAYSLLKTGKDQWSVSWPIFNFRAYGDYPTTLNMYLSMPFIYFFGLNEWSIRFVSALSGFTLVIVSYFLGQEIFKDSKKSYLLMLLTSISPWTFFPSRGVFQSTVAQIFFSLALLLLIKSFKKIKFLPLAVFFASISTYAYHNTKIVVPILLFTYLLLNFKNIKKNLITQKKHFIIATFIIILFLLPQIISVFNSDAQARSRWVFAINPASINEIENNRNNFSGNPLIAKFLYNKGTYLARTIFKNYLGFVNPNVLFFNSTQNYQFNIPNTGLLYPICLPFFYVGLLILIKRIFLKKDKEKLSLFLITTFIISLIPAVITVGDFPVIRAMTVLPLPQVFISIGFFQILSFFKNKMIKKIFSIIILIILLWQAVIYFQNYFNDYAKKYSQSWQYGYKQIVSFIKDNYSQYDQIIITKKYGEAHEFILFYWPWNPNSYQNDPKLNWDFHADWYWVNAFDKFKFINDWEIKQETQNLNQKTLLITSPKNYNQDNTLLKTVNFLDEIPAFDILEINNLNET